MRGRVGDAWGTSWSDQSRWLLLANLAALVAIAWIAVGEGRHEWRNDAYGYWNAWDNGLYDLPWLDHFAYVYSPAFAQATWPWTQLSWNAAWALVVLLQVGLLTVLVGPILALAILLFPLSPLEGYANPVMATIHNGNVQLLLAAGVAAGYRWPAAWAIPIHMKVTPGIGLLWFAVRGEWRRLAIAVGATALVALVSFVLAPDLWFGWADLLRAAAGEDTLRKEPVLALPLAVRLVLAAVLVTWGARTDRYWTVGVGAMLALPAIQLGGFAVAVAAVPFLLGRSRRLHWLIPSTLLRFWRAGPPTD